MAADTSCVNPSSRPEQMYERLWCATGPSKGHRSSGLSPPPHLRCQNARSKGNGPEGRVERTFSRALRGRLLHPECGDTGLEVPLAPPASIGPLRRRPKLDVWSDLASIVQASGSKMLQCSSLSMTISLSLANIIQVLLEK